MKSRKLKHIDWQKVVTREFSFLWASYTAEVYKSMEKLTGTTLKDNLFFSQGRILTIYRNPKDVLRSYKLIEHLAAKNPAQAQENMDKFEANFELGNALLKKINKAVSKDKKGIRSLLLSLDKTFLNVISYYLFVAFLGYAGDLPANRKFLKLHKKQFERIRMCSMDTDFHLEIPRAFGKLNKKLLKETLYMSRLELIKYVKGQKVDWNKIKKRQEKALLIVKNNKGKEYNPKQIEKVLNKELAYLKIDLKAKELTGMVVFKGKVSGAVVKIMGKNEYKKIRPGSIVVTPMTKPDLVPYLKNVKGIVTNDGGALCHASIISREMQIPCIVGTKYATDIFQDGDLIEVNANTGTIRKI